MNGILDLFCDQPRLQAVIEAGLEVWIAIIFGACLGAAAWDWIRRRRD